MFLNTKKFINSAQSKFINDPFGVSGLAFWKVEKHLANAENFHSDEVHYSIVDEKLVYYWSASSKPFLIPISQLSKLKLINLHCKYEYIIGEMEETHSINQYYPLSYESNPIEKVSSNHDFHMVTLDWENTDNWSKVAALINESTKGKLTSSAISSWTREPVYCPKLWIGAIDNKINRLMGVGISNFNPTVKETELDWFYVREEYQGRGVGAKLVQETINRCKKMSQVIRIVGEADGFYERCGFRKKDKWYYLVNKKEQVGWW